jgi:hypothetical protein
VVVSLVICTRRAQTMGATPPMGSAILGCFSSGSNNPGPGGNGPALRTRLLGRLAALVPLPSVRRHRDFAVLAPNSLLRTEVTAMALPCIPPSKTRRRGCRRPLLAERSVRIGSRAEIRDTFLSVNNRPQADRRHHLPIRFKGVIQGLLQRSERLSLRRRLSNVANAGNIRD